MMPHTLTYKFRKYHSYISQKRAYQNRLPLIKSLFSLILIILLSGHFCITAKSTFASSRIFDINKKSFTINTSHNKITQSVMLKKSIIYNDTLNRSAINFYYINNPSPDYILYIKCINENISAKYIQLFDNNYKELNYSIKKKSPYLYIDLESISSDISSQKYIYMTIGNASSSSNHIKILYEKKTLPEESSLSTSKNKNNNKTKTHKNASEKSKKKNKIKKSTKVKPASKKHTSINKVLQKRTSVSRTDTKNNNNTHTIKTVQKSSIKKSTQKKKKKNSNNKIKKSAKTVRLLSVSLSNNYISLKKGNIIYLKANIRPSKLNGCRYNWTTSNKKIAAVSNGKVIGKAPGLAIIKVTIKHNKIVKTATCTIHITK